MNIVLDEIADLTLHRAVGRIVKSLQRKFKITVCDDVIKAMELAVYLDVFGHRDLSLRFMESFLFDIQYSESSGVWGDKLDGLCLLAWRYRDLDREIDYMNVFKVVESINFDKTDTDWLVVRAKRDYENYSYSDKIKYELVKNELTEKDRLQGHYWNIKTCTYYHEHLLFYRSSDQLELIQSLSDFIHSEQIALREELKA